jgi:hypothetical protein
VAQPPAHQHCKRHDDRGDVYPDDLFHKLVLSINFGSRAVATLPLGLWQEPMNSKRVKPNHHQRENYNYVVHNLVFPSAEQLGVASGVPLVTACV